MGDTADSLLAEVRRQFQAADLDDPAQEARILVSGLLGLSLTQFLSRGGDAVSPEAAARVRAAVGRRLAHEPVHRILGERSFFGLTLGLSPETLEPRPDTETLVETMLPFVADIVERTGQCRIVDLGTGTGAICLALLSAFPLATGVGVDLSAGALATAVVNARRNGLDGQFSVVESDWFERLTGQFDIVVSNPPYIASVVVDGLDPEVRDYDPRLALDGGADGLDAYRIIASGVAKVLAPRGVIGLEIGYDQKLHVTDLFEAASLTLAGEAADLGGRDRVLVFC
ncbi:peptide chain release factor N(5)-glutamine methyltransferase [Pararhizobium sp.]|uniref:peptide chain release factor N(5)-glutamine methyltransferase n=1 Tax=Pararhizobium sp. TaxID=1977563 RepID=UPI002715D67D|nr:peptide chain release factor N(5)-glutamine methyltransferase [Pararhizobium sp.]MDO9417896.1 peptide chain release factor N(5)-glutamine methyltransferase [Pararhizobium sp.]